MIATKELLRRGIRRLIVFALDGPPVLLAELIEMKDSVDDELGDMHSRLDDLGDELRNKDYAVPDHDHDGEYAREGHDHDGTYAFAEVVDRNIESLDARVRAIEEGQQ